MISNRSMMRMSALAAILAMAGCALFRTPTVEVVGPSSICEMKIVRMTDAQHDWLISHGEQGKAADLAIRTNNGAILDCRQRAEYR